MKKLLPQPPAQMLLAMIGLLIAAALFSWIVLEPLALAALEEVSSADSPPAWAEQVISVLCRGSAILQLAIALALILWRLGQRRG